MGRNYEITFGLRVTCNTGIASLKKNTVLITCTSVVHIKLTVIL